MEEKSEGKECREKNDGKGKGERLRKGGRRMDAEGKEHKYGIEAEKQKNEALQRFAESVHGYRKL